MRKFLFVAAVIGGLTALAISCFAIGYICGADSAMDGARKIGFDTLGLLGTWVSGIGALAAASVALRIADDQRREALLGESIRTLHHTMAVVGDLRQRVVYVEKILTEGRRPLAVLVSTSDGMMRRYESLYEREAYRTLPGNIIDLIGDISGDICGVESIVGMLSHQLDNKMNQTVPRRATSQSAGSGPIGMLFNKLDAIYDALEVERARIERA